MRLRDWMTGSGALGDWVVRHPRTTDSLLAVFAAFCTAMVALNLQDVAGPDAVGVPSGWPSWLIIILPSAALPFRRLYPSLALVGGALAQAVMWGSGFSDTYLVMTILTFSAAFHGKRRGEQTAVIVSIVMTVYTASGALSGNAPAYAVLIVGLLGLAMTALGIGVSNRLAYADEVEARAIELERSRELDQSWAIAEERNRIARELHDVVAHGLSVMVVQASAAQRIIDRDPSGAAAALHQIEETGRNALTEMRQVLNAVRTDPEDSWRPAPTLNRVEELIGELSAAGLEVDLRQTEPDGDDVPLPTTIDMAAYRIVQESLTNVMKHGGPQAKATVDITRKPEVLSLAIVDNGIGVNAVDAGGYGIQGMRERVEFFGGSFHAQPRRLRGFEVLVELPIDAAPSRTAQPIADEATIRVHTDS